MKRRPSAAKPAPEPGDLINNEAARPPAEGSKSRKNPLGRCQAIMPAAGDKQPGDGCLIVPTQSAQTACHTRLGSIFDLLRGDDRVLIVISADPDAMASAAAVKRLLWRRVALVTIAAVNQVKRPDNLQLLETLKMKLEPFASIDRSQYTRLIMVDSQPAHSPLTEKLAFDVVIDHHPPSPLPPDGQNPPFVDIRPDLGATATMMVGYLKAANIKPNRKLATALFYAIKTDTNNFVRQGQLEDMKAFRWLYPFINPELLADIERAPIARSSYKKVVAGLNAAVFHKNKVHSFLGKTDHSDTLVIVADFLMQIKGVNRSIAAGICGDKVVIIFRAGGARQDVGQIAAKAFGELGSAGGHKHMARAEVPLANLDPKIKDNPAAIGRFILRRLREAAA